MAMLVPVAAAVVEVVEVALLFCYKIMDCKVWLPEVVVEVVVEIPIPAAPVLDHMAVLLQDSMVKPEPTIQPMVAVEGAVEGASMAAPVAAAMAVHMAAGRAQAILVVRPETRAQAGVIFILMGLIPTVERLVGNQALSGPLVLEWV